MSDLVVTVPRDLWVGWIAEGDAAGEPETGQEWGFRMGEVCNKPKPPIESGEHLYIVAHDRVRGRAPVTRVCEHNGWWMIGREGGAVAVTIPDLVPGFRGYRRRWWNSSLEVPFPEWKTADLWLNRKQAELKTHHRPAEYEVDFDGRPKGLCGQWALCSTEDNLLVDCKGCLRKLEAAGKLSRAIVKPTDKQVALFVGAPRGTPAP